MRHKAEPEAFGERLHLRHGNHFASGAAQWQQARAAFTTVQAAEAWACHGAWIERERPRFGPGAGTAVIAAAVVWFFAYLHQSVALVLMGVFPASMMLVGTVWGLVEIVVLSGFYQMFAAINQGFDIQPPAG